MDIISINQWGRYCCDRKGNAKLAEFLTRPLFTRAISRKGDPNLMLPIRSYGPILERWVVFFDNSDVSRSLDPRRQSIQDDYPNPLTT